MDRARRSAMRGFSLLEAMISVGILAGAVLALSSAMLGSMHDTTKIVSRQTLTDVAADVLTDLRVAAAYQPEVLERLLAHPPARFDVSRRSAAGTLVTISVDESVRRSADPAAYDVVVETTGDGSTQTLSATLSQQAVAPGSTVTAAPDASSTGDSGAYGPVGDAPSAGGAAPNPYPAPTGGAGAAAAPSPTTTGEPGSACFQGACFWPKRPAGR